MKKSYLILACLIVFACAVMPAQAFTAKSLTITLETNGDAYVDIQYDLSFLEYAAVFLKMADPAAELQKALEGNINRPVAVQAADNSHAGIVIYGFADSANDDAGLTMTTPSLSFARAEAVVKQYWFAPLISPDFSPTETRVVFPDGYTATFHDQITIPSVSHRI